MSQSLRTIKFTGKKCVMKPMKGEEGITETWEVSDSVDSKEFFHYKGQIYKLISSTKKK